MAKQKQKYASEVTLDKVLEIVYNALLAKADVTQLTAIEETITEIQQAAANALTVDDVLTTFEGYTEEADGNKVIAAKLFKDIVDKLEAGYYNQEVDLTGYLKNTDVISSFDDLNAEVLQVVSATLVKALSDKIDTLTTAVGDTTKIVRVGEDGKVPSDVLPSYVDDVIDAYLVEETDGEGNVTSRKLYKDAEHTEEIEYEGGKIYNDISTEDGASWRWSGTKLTKIASDDLVPITREEVQEMWNNIVVPDGTTEEKPTV